MQALMAVIGRGADAGVRGRDGESVHLHQRLQHALHPAGLPGQQRLALADYCAQHTCLRARSPPHPTVADNMRTMLRSGLATVALRMPRARTSDVSGITALPFTA